MDTRINDFIPTAIKLLEEAAKPNNSLYGIYEGNEIKGIYESYLSQFGPMAIQLGMRSTFAVYYNNENKGDGNRKYILELIYKVVSSKTSYNHWIRDILCSEPNFAKEEEILDASVALKRAIRTFSLTSKNDNL
ncbi:MAG: hypothetical protein IPL35_12730 [Sphingobacteriales bacterium]|nr:hypothetical protein [Sphingobacteriales bacterium]